MQLASNVHGCSVCIPGTLHTHFAYTTNKVHFIQYSLNTPSMTEVHSIIKSIIKVPKADQRLSATQNGLNARKCTPPMVAAASRLIM